MAYFDNVFVVLIFQCIFSVRITEQFIVNFSTNLGSNKMSVEVFSLHFLGVHAGSIHWLVIQTTTFLRNVVVS